MFNSVLEALFTPAAAAVALAALTVSAILLLVGRKRFSSTARVALGTVCGLCLVYACIVLIVSLAFGEAPPRRQSRMFDLKD